MKHAVRKLNGSVRKIESEIAMFEVVDGMLTESEPRPNGYCFYDRAGKLIEEISPYRHLVDDVYKDVYFYDDAGGLLYREEYNENDSIIGKTVFEQSENGSRVERHYYVDKRGKLKLGSHALYDDEGEVVETARYDENEKVSPRRVYLTDRSLRAKKLTLTDAGYAVEELILGENGVVRDEQATRYDANGNVEEFACFEADGTLRLKDEYEYEFDSHGNWVKQTQRHWIIGWGKFELVPLTVVRRKIEYY